MNRIPFLGFGRKPGDKDENEELDLPIELVELPTDEEREDEEKEEKPNEETKQDDDDDRPISNDDEMLKVFMAVDEEFVDNSGLAGRIEDVQATELVEELRVLASAFGIDVETAREEAV